MRVSKIIRRKADKPIYICAEFTARPGGIVTVPLIKYNQLMHDFPGEWEDAERPEPRKTTRVESPIKVSVIIPTLNDAHLISRAIESVLNQTHANIEIIVVDDGSTDNTAEVVGRYPTVVYHPLDHNYGISCALNEGIRKSTGEFVNWLSADDWYESDCVEMQMREFTENPELEMVYSAYHIVYSDNYHLTTLRNQRSAYHPSPPHDVTSLLEKNLKGCHVNACTASIRRKVFDEIGLFDESLRISQDWEFFLRIMCRKRFKLIKEPLATRFEHNNGLTQKVTKQSPFFDEEISKRWNIEREIVAEKYRNPKVMINDPLVSIIIPVYNRENLIDKAIHSVTHGGKQSYANVEVIVVDDASTDGTRHAIQQFVMSDKRVKYIRRKENGGVAEALNTGIKASKGRYVCWLSSDDYFSDKDKIKKQLQKFKENPDLRLVHSEFNIVWDDPNIASSVHKIPEFKDKHEMADHHLNKEHLVNGSAVMMDRRLFREIGLFNPAYRYCQDRDFFLRALRSSGAECIREPLVSNLQHKGILGYEYMEPKTEEQKFNRQVFEKEKELIDKYDRILKEGHPTICAMICLKNEEEGIEETLNDLIQWVDYIVVFNDGSTDRSSEIIRQYPKVVDVFDSPPKGNVRTEAKDRKKLYEMAKATGADWILAIDSDEVFENSMKWQVFDLVSDPDINLYYAHQINFWRSLTNYRVDELWDKGWFARLFRDLDGLTCGITQEHCGLVPHNIPGATLFPGDNCPKGKKIEPRVKHRHFADWDTTVKKYMDLMQRDPHHYEEGAWRGGSAYYNRVVDENGLKLAEYEGDDVASYLRRGLV